MSERLAELFRSYNLRLQGPVPHKKRRGRITIRDAKSGTESRVHHGCIIHTRELRVYNITQEAINALIQVQCPRSVEIEVRKGLVNV